jgi:hypothetical protein
MEDNDKNGVQVLNRRRSERSEKCARSAARLRKKMPKRSRLFAESKLRGFGQNLFR